MKSLYVSAMIMISIFLVAGCQQRSERLNAPPQGEAFHRNPMAEYFDTMVTSSAHEDLTVADFHFVGTSDELSGVGEYRLDQLVGFFTTYGGALRYDTHLQDNKLVQQRLERLENYLADAGCDMDRCSVRVGMAASVGMSAQQAIKAQSAGLAPDTGDAAGSLMPPVMPGMAP